MAEKVSGRWEENRRSGSDSSGLQLTVTRKGVEVFGWFDHYCGIEGVYLTWDELDAMRARVAASTTPRKAHRK